MWDNDKKVHWRINKCMNGYVNLIKIEINRLHSKQFTNKI